VYVIYLSRRRRRKLERGETFQSGLKRDMDCDLCIYAGSLRPLGIHVEHVPAIFFSFSQVEREIVKKTIQRKKKKNKYKKVDRGQFRVLLSSIPVFIPIYFLSRLYR
jgi:hypothetical protein